MSTTPHTIGHPAGLILRTSIGRKYLVGAAGAFLAIFVLGHTLGNLQVFLGPDAINRYAWHLHSLPYQLLWVIRAVVVTALGVHVILAGLLHAGNRGAGGRGYAEDRYLATTRPARHMMLGGTGILLFLIWHILHFTTRSVIDFSAIPPWPLPEEVAPVMNVHGMMYLSFVNPWMSAVYVAATALVAAHLSHGVAGVFQTFGWLNGVWAPRLRRIARGYAIFVFVGLASIPLAVLADAHLGVPIFDTTAIAPLLEVR